MSQHSWKVFADISTHKQGFGSVVVGHVITKCTYTHAQWNSIQM